MERLATSQFYVFMISILLCLNDAVNLLQIGFLSIIEHVKLPSIPELKLFGNLPNNVCEADRIDN